MFSFFKTKRFPESVACAVLFSGAITLHVIWMCNLLMSRSPQLQKLFSLGKEMGPVIGLYIFSWIVFALLFVLGIVFWKSKDCSHHRDSMRTFFYASLIVFFVMTLPFVYQFSVLVE